MTLDGNTEADKGAKPHEIIKELYVREEHN